jgi:hypothetical protein
VSFSAHQERLMEADDAVQTYHRGVRDDADARAWLAAAGAEAAALLPPGASDSEEEEVSWPPEQTAAFAVEGQLMQPLPLPGQAAEDVALVVGDAAAAAAETAFKAALQRATGGSEASAMLLDAVM